MNRLTPPSCTQCQRLQARIDGLTAQLEATQAELASVRTQLAAARKDSSTSSKPPSSDIVKPQPPAPADGGRRTIGGQPGHPKHERPLFPPEKVTSFFEHTLDACPGCGGCLGRNGPLVKIVQQVDVHQPTLTVEQHTAPEYWCGQCRKAYKAPMPRHIEKGGLVGPQLTVLIAYMKGVCHASFSTVRKYLRDVVRVSISRGELCNIIRRVSYALDKPYEELVARLPQEPVINVDETGHRNNKDRMWTWCMRAGLYTVYHIDPSRSADVLMAKLGKDFAGTLGCDYFSAYRRYMRECGISLQFCLAHLIRDVKFLTTLPDPRDRRYGEELRKALKNLFAVIHQRDELTPEQFQSRLALARAYCLVVGLNAPPTRHGQTMANRFRKHGEAYFTFITTPGVEPTNNVAEQAIRFVVIDRLITQGTRSERGQRWCERIWTAIATCVQQGRSVYEFLEAAVRSWFSGSPAPSLIPKP